MTTLVTHRPHAAEARLFNGTLTDAENIKDWASGFDITWAPFDENYNDPVDEEPDLTKGVTLDVVGHLGYQSANAGDWLVKDALGVSVYTEGHLKHYFSEVTSNEQ